MARARGSPGGADGGANELVALHSQCLSASAFLASDRLACQGALPLLAYALHFGSHCKGVDLDAQTSALSLLMRLIEAHGVRPVAHLTQYRLACR